MCDWKVFTVMLVVDQLTIFVESSPVPLVAHPNKFIGIGILIVYAPFNVSEFWVSYTHCILVAFGGENYGEYARSLKRFSFIAIQHLRWLWTFLGISNSGITVFSSDLLETVVTTTKSQNI